MRSAKAMDQSLQKSQVPDPNVGGRTTLFKRDMWAATLR